MQAQVLIWSEKKPLQDFKASVSADIGSWDSYRTDIDVSTPLMNQEVFVAVPFLPTKSQTLISTATMKNVKLLMQS